MELDSCGLCVGSSDSCDVSEGGEVSLIIGKKFSSYKELDDQIKAYEIARSIQLCHRDSRTIEAARKRVPRKVEGAKKELKYYTIHFVCSFGGKPYRSKSAGQRAQQM